MLVIDKIKKNKLIFIFLITGMLQMLIGRWLGVHDGLEHMVFNYWWQYLIEGLLYSLCHVCIYRWFRGSDV